MPIRHKIVDSAGTYLMLDGKPLLSAATATDPYVYSLDTDFIQQGFSHLTTLGSRYQ